MKNKEIIKKLIKDNIKDSENSSKIITVLLIVFIVIVSFIFGGITVYFLLVGSVERVINDLHGLFVNNQLIINVNETKLIS